MRPNIWRGDSRGITLLDLLVGLMLLAVGGVGIFAGFKSALAGWTTGQQFVGEQHNARVVLDWVTRRLRMAGNGYAGTRFEVANVSEIVFSGNADDDTAIECYRVYLNAAEGVVYVNVTEGSPPASCAGGVGQPLSANVEAKTFTVTALIMRYFDREVGSGNELTSLPLSSIDRARIRRIQIEIRVTGVQVGSPVSMTTQVIFRNN